MLHHPTPSRPWTSILIVLLVVAALAGATWLLLSQAFSAAPARPARDLSDAFGTLDAKGPAAARAAAEAGELRGAEAYFRWRTITSGSLSDRESLAYAVENSAWPGMQQLGLGLTRREAEALPPQKLLELQALFDDGSVRTELANFAALEELNLQGELSRQVRALWTRGDILSTAEQDEILESYGAYLSQGDHILRFHRLMSGSSSQSGLPNATRTQAAASIRHLVPDDLDLVRVAWATGTDSAREQVPAKWANHAALLTREVWELQTTDPAAASALFRAINPETRNAEAEWRLRRILVRNAIRAEAYGEAYEMATTHGLGLTNEGLTAELMAGWILLTYADLPGLALPHFERVAGEAPGPWLRSKALRGQARALDALGRPHAARQVLRTCAAQKSTLYALLCLEDLGQRLEFERPRAHPSQIENEVFGELYEVLNVLILADRPEFEVLPFARAAFEEASTIHEVALVAQTLKSREDLAFTHTTGICARRGLPEFSPSALRTVTLPNERATSVPSALTLAVIAQESQFRPTVRSPAGAVGLMQVLPNTGEAMATKLGLGWSPDLLTDGDTNIALGTAYLDQLLTRYDGSVLLALAAYNAGPSRVEAWLRDFGDPRQDEIAPEDWIDAITIGETRIYVQRVLTNVYLYQAALNGRAQTPDPTALMRGF